LVPSVFGLPSLLPEPTPILGGFCSPSRSAALPGMNRVPKISVAESYRAVNKRYVIERSSA
jgi:hypothetical protein